MCELNDNAIPYLHALKYAYKQKPCVSVENAVPSVSQGKSTQSNVSPWQKTHQGYQLVLHER